MEKNRKKHHSILHTCLNSALALAMFLSPITSIVAEDTSMPVSTEAPAETAVPAEEPAAEEQVVTAEAPAEEPVTEPAEEAVPVQEAEPAPTPAPTPAAALTPTAAPTAAATEAPSAAPTADAALVTEETAAKAETIVPEETPAASAAAEASETPEPSATPEASATPEPEEPEYLPAGTFTGSTSQMTVSVSYGEETFKVGTEMKVAYVSRSEAIAAAEQTASEDQEVIDAMAVDITFTDSDGNEVQPEGAVSVSLEPRRALASTETSTQEVLHKEDNGNVQVVGNADVSAAGAEFSADHFSIYVISSKDSPAIATYIFHDADGNVLADYTQKVKNDEIVYAPTTPEKTGSKFLGWSYVKDAAALQDGDPGDFNQITASVSSTGDVNLYPVFQQAYYVFFLDNQGRVSTTKEGASGARIEVSDVTIPLDSTHSVTGWYTDAELTSKVDSVTLSDHNVTLYPKVEEGHYLYFSSGDGASYVKPVFVAANGKTAKPEEPARPGYTFSHWSAEEGGSEYSFGSPISEDTTLYAVWEANSNTKYTIIYWWENANDEDYSYHDNKVEYGVTGSKINIGSISKTYAGFTLNTDKTNQANSGASISGDGSTIVNIYYSRNTYAIKFYKSEYSWWSYSWKEMTKLRITAKYGANISEEWPKSTSKIWGTTKGDDGNGAAPYQSGISTMPLYGDEFYYVSQSGIYTMNLNYYLEGLDGKYVLDHKDSFKSDNNTWSTTAEDHYDIEGFTYLKNVKDGSKFNYVSNYVYEVSFRYSRNSYSIKFVNGDSTSSRTFKYGEDISKVDLQTAPERPAGTPSGYTFAGWFDNELGAGSPVVLTGTMPAYNITLYAKWAAPTYTGTVHTNIKGTGTPMEVIVNYGDKINENDMPTVKETDGTVIQEGNGSYTVTVPAGYTWAGWATKSGDDYTIYNFNTGVYSDITLYPYYINGEKYTVSYSRGEGTGTAPVDSKQYAENSYADIMSAAGIAAPKGKTFLYWTDDSKNAYYPGDKVKVAADLELTAVYGDTAQKTSITYHSNYPAGSGLTEKTSSVDGQENNTTITLEKAGFAAPDGYYFAHWKDAGGKQYAVGTEIGIDNTSANHLYAVWEQKKEITLKANSGTYTYDGSTHSAAGVETDTFTINGVSYTVSGYTTSSPEKKEAGNYPNIISGTYVVKDGSGADVTDQFTVNIENGSLTISKRTVNLKSESASKAYDGIALTKPEVTIAGDGFVIGEVSELKATGSITKAGSVQNTITYTAEAGFNAGNYEITKSEGTLTITQNAGKITVTAGSDTKVYDGTALTKNTYSIAGLPEGFTAVVTVSGSIKDAGSAENKVTSVTIKKDGENVTDQFSGIETVSGTLTVTKRTVTLKSESASKAFDGTPLTKPDVIVGGDRFVDGEISSLKATGTITKAGSVTNTIEYTENGRFKADNYTITKDEGTLTITQNENAIVVNAKNAEKKYDGNPLAKNEADVTGLPEGYTAKVTVTGSITDAGTADNVVGDVIIRDASGNDVTDQFKTITKNNGTLTVTKRSVTLTSESVSREYDGIALTAPNVTMTGDGFVTGEVTDLKATGTITNVGSVTNSIAYTEGTGFKAGNYEIKKSEGTLTITQNTAAITVTAGSDIKMYDGTALTKSTYSITGLPAEFTTVVMVSGSITDVGTVANKVVSVTIWKNNEDVTGQFSGIQTADGTLTVEKRKVTLTSESASKAYDGIALTKPEVTIAGDGFVIGEVSELKATGSITKAGSVQNTITYTAEAGFNAGNYEITKSEGTLTITQNAGKITVTAGSDTKVYDGTALTKNTYSIAGLPEGFTAVVTVSGSIKDAGSAENKVTSVTIKKDGENVTDQFSGIETVSGTLTVTKRTVKLTSESASKQFDGKPLTRPAVAVSGDGFVTGEVSDLQASGSITNTGSTANTITYKTLEGFKADNYSIELDEGTLTIRQNENEIVVNAKNAEKKYDGRPLAKNEADVTGLPEGYTAEVTVSGTITNAGSVANVVETVMIHDVSGNDVTGQFKTITKNNGTLTVTKRSVTLTSETVTREYNGTALTAPNVTMTGDGFVTGEVTDLKATGTITNVGSVTNTIAYTEGTGFKADNYEIKKSEGTLTITANTAAIEVKADSDSKTYDGTALTKSSYSVTGLPEGFAAEATVTGSITDAGTVDNVIASVVIKKDDEDVTDQFSNIAKTKGTLTITLRKVTLTSGSASKAYDGTALTKPEVEVSGDRFVAGEVSDVKATGSITKIGSVTNTITYSKNKGFKASNYEITKAEGTLTITANTAAIKVTADSDSKTYDGTALTKSTFSITGLPEGFTPDVTVSGSITDAGTAVNEVKSVVIRKDGKDVTDQFTNIETASGTLTVNKRTVNLKSESASKVFDGTALTAPNVAVTGDGFVASEVAELKAVGTITKAGSVKNEIRYTVKSGFKADNYTITKDEGILTITQNEDEIVVNAKNAAKTYDGTALTESGSEVIGLPNGYTAEVTVSGSITNVGTAENKVTSVVIRKGDEDVTDQFKTITKNSGTLTVSKRSVSLSSETASREYDGTPLTAPKVTVGGDGFVAGEVKDLKATGTITNVGSVVNAIAYTENSSFKAGNYEITKSEGTLTITQNAAAITVTAGSDTKMYDGTALTKSTYSITGLPAEFTTVVMVSGSLTDAGTADNIVTSVVIKKGDEDVTDQFSNISKANGTLTVTKRKVTLKSEDASKAYDGIALTAPAVTVSGDGFVTGEVSDLRAAGSIIKAGSVKNAIEYTENSGFKAGNYEIEKIEGTLTVTVNAAAITVTAESDSKTYDGTVLTKNSYSIAGLPAGFTSAVMISGSITNAGTADNIVTSVVIKKGDEDVTDQFSSIRTENGTLTVSTRKVTLTSASASKVYDGTALTAPEVTVAGDGFVTGEVSDLKAAGTITDVGDVPNTITYTKKFGFKAGNYEITENLGTLSITAADISDETRFTVDYLNDLVYNGLDQAEEPAVTDTESGKTLVKNADYTLTFSEDVKNVGEVTVTVDGIGNYTGTVKRTYQITPASLLIVTPDAEKEYDGTPLTAAGTIEGLVNGETVSFGATGSQITVGSSENTYSLVWDGTASESNYTAEAKTGTLTVIAADISNADKFTVSQPENVVYNGLEQKQPVTVERVKASAMNAAASFFSDLLGFINADADDAILLEGTDYTLAYSDNLIDAGTVTITVTGIGNYTGTVVRTYQITPAPLTISTGSASKIYDGTALTNAETAVEGLMTVRDSITVTANGSQTAVGSSANGYSIEWGNTLAANYELAENLGTLTVNAAPAPSTPAPSTPAPTPYVPETGADTPYTPVTAAVPYTPYTGARTPYTPNTGRPYTPNTSDDGILRWFWMLGGSMILAAASYEVLRKSRKN